MARASAGFEAKRETLQILRAVKMNREAKSR